MKIEVLVKLIRDWKIICVTILQVNATRKELCKYIITFLALFFFLEAYIKVMKNFFFTIDKSLSKRGSYLVCNNLHFIWVLTLLYTTNDHEIIKQFKPQVIKQSMKILFSYVLSR